jgi:Secretion system C-terminal sorting domain
MAGEPIKQHNWENSMGTTSPDNPEMCVKLTGDYMLYIKLHLNIEVNNITTYPAMYFRYNYRINNGTVQSGVVGPVTNSMLMPFYVNGVFSHYRASFSIPFNSNAACGNNNSTFYYGLEYQLVTPTSNPVGYTPYAVGNYPIAWPKNKYDVPATIYDDWVNESKLICCPPPQIIRHPDGALYLEDSNPESTQQSHTDGSGTDSSQTGADANSIPAAAAGQLRIAPNPFGQAAKVQFNLSEPGPVEFTCLDAQGKLVKSYTTNYQTSGQQETQLDLSAIPPGLYYLRMSTASGVQIAKMVKTGG